MTDEEKKANRARSIRKQEQAHRRKIMAMREADGLPEKPKYDPAKEIAARATGQRYIPRNEQD